MANPCKWMYFGTVSAHTAHTICCNRNSFPMLFVSLSLSLSLLLEFHIIPLHTDRVRGTPVPHIRVYVVFVYSAHSFWAPPTHTQNSIHNTFNHVALHVTCAPKSIWGFIYVCAVRCLVCAYDFPKCIVYFALTLDWRLEIDKIVDSVYFEMQFLYFLVFFFYCWFSCCFVTHRNSHRPRHPTDRISMLGVLIVLGCSFIQNTTNNLKIHVN